MIDHGMHRDRRQLITRLPARLRSRPLAYALAAALPLAAVGARLALGFASGDAPAMIFFVIPIILCAHLGGLGPGLVATGLSGILIDYFLLPPLHSIMITSRLQLIQWGALLMTGVLVSALSEGLHWARQRAEASYRLQSVTLASIGDAVITTDIHGRITFLNTEAERLTGWTLAEAVDQPLASVFRIINASSRAPVDNPATKVLQSGSVVGLANHTVLIGRDGRETPIDDSGAPIQEPNGTIEGVVLVFRDITERERAERELRESAEWLRLGYDAAGLGIWRHEIPAGMIHFDRPARDHYGSEADDASIGDVLSRIHSEDLGRLEREIATATDPASDGRYATEYRVIHADGNERWLAVHARVIFEGEGSERRPTHGFGTSQDITNRKRAEAALHDKSFRLRVLADTSRAIAEAGTDLQPLLDRIAQAITEMLGDGCSITLFGDDEEWLYRSAVYDSDPEKQSQHRTILGASRLHVSEAVMFAQVLRTDKALVFSQLDLDRVRAVAKPANLVLLERLGIHTGIVMPMHAQGRTIGGLTLYRRQPHLPAFDHDDLVLVQDLADRAALAISNARLLSQVQRELAERTRAEAEIRSLSGELEQRVAERTAELIAANHELESFSYSVSHDLRAPLRAIDGFSRILLEDYVDALPSEAQHYFDLLRSNAQRMGQLVDDLLAFSRLSRQPLRKQPIDLASLIARCLSELHAEQEGRSLEIQIGDLPACTADPALLMQVWLNLLANALKYTRQRNPAVIVIDSIIQGAETVYRIVDNGVGFDMHYVDKLFGVFQRLHRAEEFEGTGVGLAIVQRIVQRHGGRIWAEAAVDKGATFAFTLGGALPQPT